MHKGAGGNKDPTVDAKEIDVLEGVVVADAMVDASCAVYSFFSGMGVLVVATMLSSK